MDKEIYVLKWMPQGRVPAGGAAYTDKARAEAHAESANKNLKWWYRLSGGQWIVSTLMLREGPKDA